MGRGQDEDPGIGIIGSDLVVARGGHAPRKNVSRVRNDQGPDGPRKRAFLAVFQKSRDHVPESGGVGRVKRPGDRRFPVRIVQRRVHPAECGKNEDEDKTKQGRDDLETHLHKSRLSPARPPVKAFARGPRSFSPALFMKIRSSPPRLAAKAAFPPAERIHKRPARPTARTPRGVNLVFDSSPRPREPRPSRFVDNAGYLSERLFLCPKIPPPRKSPAPMTKPKLYHPPLLWTS